MKRLLQLFVLLLTMTGSAEAHLSISGTVTDKSGYPVTGANVMIKGTYEGASTDTAGYFQLETTETGEQVILVSFIRYRTVEESILVS